MREAMNQVELSARLALLAQWIPDQACVADIGTDHGLLPVALLQSGSAQRVIATDVRSRPLEKAKACARRYRLADRISFRLCDGLSALSPEEADCIVIAGMGGETISDILHAAPWTAAGGHRLILQPMTKAEELRRFLWCHGYRIEAERLVRDKSALYLLILARGGTEPEGFKVGELYIGRSLPARDDPLFPEYLHKQIRRLGHAIAGAKRSSKACDILRLLEFETAYQELITLSEELQHADGKRDL